MGTTNIIDPSGEPVEVGPGRGDLRYSSMPADQWFALGGARGGLQLVGGKTVSHARLFSEQPWIASAVMRMLTWSVRVPLKCYRRVSDDDRVRLGPSDHPLAAAIRGPWEGAGQYQLVQALLGPLLVHGNGLVDVDEGARGAIRFDDLDWRTVQPIKASLRRIAGWKVREDGEERELSADRVVHAAWWSPAGPTGVSPLRQLGTTVRLEDAAQRYAESYLKHSARPSSAVTASKEFLGLEREKREKLLAQLRGDIDTLYAGPENAGRPVLVPPGLSWDTVAHTAVEAELIKSRIVAREEVMGVYLIPPAMVGILDKANYANMGAQREMAYTDGLGPPLVLIEQAFNAQVVRHLLREDDIYLEFDFAGVLRGDRLKEIQALREAIDGGLMTRNEGRAVLNLPRSDQTGMDDFYYQANNARPVGDTDEGLDRDEEAEEAAA
jgi:HK97 family phage portal protein